MTEFLVDNIYVSFGAQLFRQSTIGIPMGTNFVPLLADKFLNSNENECSDKLINEGKRKFILSYRHIDDISIKKDLRNTFTIFTPKDPPFPRLQNLLQLLLIS